MYFVIYSTGCTRVVKDAPESAIADWLKWHAGAIETAKAGSPVDIMLGIGGTPEGDPHYLLLCLFLCSPRVPRRQTIMTRSFSCTRTDDQGRLQEVCGN